MSKRLLLSIDVGTSGCKITAFDFTGKATASHTGSYKTYYEQFGFVEQDAVEWWRIICQSIQELIRKDRLDPSEIAAIVWMVPAGHAFQWIDRGFPFAEL